MDYRPATFRICRESMPAFGVWAVLGAVGFGSLQRARAGESPGVTVSIASSATIYTATPASSAIPGFKPHINFPYLHQRADGTLLVDATVGQTQSGKVFGIGGFSSDNGATWSISTNAVTAPNTALVLPSGQTSVGVSFAMSNASGSTSWSNTRYRSTNGGTSWTTDTAFFSTGSTAYSSVYNNYSDAFQVGSTLFTSGYGVRAGDQFNESILFASTDGGQHWARRSTIAMYDTVPGMGSEGPSESSVVALGNGNLLAVSRTGQSFPSNDVNLTDPSLFFSVSSDQGNSWTAPKSLGVAGVFPTLKVLSNGLVSLTYGRYGAKVMFADETGKRWTAPTVLYNGPSSGHTELRPTADGQYAYVYDQSSFYGPSYNASPPAGYVYNNDQSANLKLLKLNIVRDPLSTKSDPVTEYHGDDAPEAVGLGWVMTDTSGGQADRSARAELGTDFYHMDTASTVGSKQLYWSMAGNGQNAWSAMNFHNSGALVDYRTRLATSLSVVEGADDLLLADGTGQVTLQISSTGVFLEGLGGNAAQASYLESTHPGFSTSAWHQYRVVIGLDALSGSLLARVFLDGDTTSPILQQYLANSSLSVIRFGDQSAGGDSTIDIDYLRFGNLWPNYVPEPGLGIWAGLSMLAMGRRRR